MKIRKKEEEVWIVKGFLTGEAPWTMSKVKFRKRWGKRLLDVSLFIWVGVFISAIFGSFLLAFLLGFVAFFMSFTGWGLRHDAKDAEQIGKAKLQKKD